MKKFVLKAELRKETGSNVAKKLRAAQLVPAELYHKGEENLSLQISSKELEKLVVEAGTTSIITIDVEGKQLNALIKDYQRHPFKNMYLHVDFQGVKMDETIKVSVPIVLANRDSIYVQPSVLLQNLEEVEIESLPAHIPQSAEVDVQNMQYNDVFYVKDLDVFKDSNVTVLTDAEEVVCSLTEPREEVINEDVEFDPNAVEVIGEKKKDE